MHAHIVISLGVCTLLLQAASRKETARSNVPSPRVEKEPVTEGEARDFASKITRAVGAAKPGEIDRLVHTQALLAHATTDLGLSEKDRQTLLRGAEEAIARGGLGEQIVKATRDGSYTLLRVCHVDGQQRVLFRMLSAGAVNYHEYFLVRYPDGEVAPEDIYNYLAGERISESMRRRIIIPSVENNRVRSFSDEDKRAILLLNGMIRSIQAEKFAEAITQFQKLPKNVQERKSILIMYMQATMQRGEAGEQAYLAAMEKFRRLYPSDASLDLIAIDYFFLKKQFDALVQAIDRLDRSVGGDPYLNVLRGNVYLEAGKFASSRAAYEAAIKAEPNLTEAYWARIALSLTERNHDDTLTWLKTIVEKRAAGIGDLTTISDYADFVKSPQHTRWQKWYAERSK